MLRSLVVRYTAFAIFATIVNLGVQRLVLAFGEGGVLFVVALGLGTLAGLLVKYVLDKRLIFYDPTTGVKAHSEKFSRYTAMGLVTTAIFWATESAFWLIWQTDLMREIGAVIGLSIGYVTKYQLDRRYVFSNCVPEPST